MGMCTLVIIVNWWGLRLLLPLKPLLEIFNNKVYYFFFKEVLKSFSRQLGIENIPQNTF